ncbi:hypothetical protein A4X13_0g8568 [Tilletia indica]|uniref:Uncharacterized protein n=1 Tax=Tilletia indica TaxID=43049 RepID=A0A177TJK1_9BASI|nr:hypothetical protein A4X13_0g8568 [Tilletia indica]
MAVAHMYDAVITAEPPAAPWYPNAGNVHKSEYRTLGTVWRGGDQLLWPQPLVYAWGQSYDLSPAWAEAVWYQHTDENFPNSGTLGKNNVNESVVIPWSLSVLNVPKRVKEMRDKLTPRQETAAAEAQPMAQVPTYPLWLDFDRSARAVETEDTRISALNTWAWSQKKGIGYQELMDQGIMPPENVLTPRQSTVDMHTLKRLRSAGGLPGKAVFQPDYAWKAFIFEREPALSEVLEEEVEAHFGQPYYLSDRDGYPVLKREGPRKVVDTEEEDLKQEQKVKRLREKGLLDDFVSDDEAASAEDPDAPYVDRWRPNGDVPWSVDLSHSLMLLRHWLPEPNHRRIHHPQPVIEGNLLQRDQHGQESGKKRPIPEPEGGDPPRPSHPTRGAVYHRDRGAVFTEVAGQDVFEIHLRCIFKARQLQLLWQEGDPVLLARHLRSV